ncbi:helix-turn-helix transcriptional regulator [Kineosporia rhizophila]|uniref:helix-turn-helix transcriptional regulator n=1 Tax=Kineosporia TaxID=49184 RepID=UPI001E461222|nr:MULTISPECIES: helix-turn-helix transcriptional regulator [Kineosporia]MCE0535340.1 helix-turn-helix transcriptional regulator [Kineosporia rhizophila]GLY16880.1 transcriptional regulator [Kineosporia sp. NBRC 101677]
MDSRRDLTQFLATRRARLRPEQAGIAQPQGRRRRVAGLRREEVAHLAGVSVEYYTRLEQGRARGASDEVLHGVAQALQLSDTERAHLFDLVRALGPAPRRTRPRKDVPQARPGLQTLVDTVTGAAVIMVSEKGDVLGANALGEELYSPMFRNPLPPGEIRNLPRFIFLDPAARTLHRDWESVAEPVVAILRAAAGRNPYDKSLSNLVGELSTRNEYFRVRWAGHDVRPLSNGQKLFHHPQVGDLDLNYEYLDVADGQGVLWLMYYAEPGTPAAEGLQLLGALSASSRTAPQPSAG